MTQPTNDPMADDPPGYSEGPPTDNTEIERAARHVDRLAQQNEPVGDALGMRGPGHETGGDADATSEEEPSRDRDA